MAASWAERLAGDREALSTGSRAERTAGILRERIIEGVFRPGERLSEEELSAALNVSRNTLREAFRQLGQEGVLVHEFGRGVFVRALSTEDVRDIYAMRRILELAAVRNLRNAPAGALDAVRHAVESAEEAAGRADWLAVGTANMRLHQALAGDDALTAVAVLALADETLEDGRLRLLDLEKQRVPLVRAEHESDPGARADAADADHLAGKVDEPELFEQVTPVGLERAPVGADEVVHLLLKGLPLHLRRKELVDRNDQRRVADDPRLTVDEPRELLEGLHAVLGARLLHCGLGLLQPFGIDAGAELRDRALQR